MGSVRDVKGFLSRALGPATWAVGGLGFVVNAVYVRPLGVLLYPDQTGKDKFASGYRQSLMWLTFEHWMLLATFGVVVLIVAGRLGRGLGLPGLFRDPPRFDLRVETLRRRHRPDYLYSRGSLTAFLGALGATLLIAEIWTVIYYFEVIENLPDLGPAHFRAASKEALLFQNSRHSHHVALLWYQLRCCGPFLALLLLAEVFPANAPGVERRGRDSCVEAVRFAAGVLLGAVATFVTTMTGAWLHYLADGWWRRYRVPSRAFLIDWFGGAHAKFPLFRIEEMYPKLNEPGETIVILFSFSMFFGFVLLFYHAIALLRHRLSPGLAICMVLSFVILFYSVLAMLSTGGQLLVIVVALVWFVIANGGPYKYRFPGMDAYYRGKSHITFRSLETAVEAPARLFGLLSNEEVLEGWRKWTGRERPRLVLVATTGGAYRAAFWTTVVLDELGRRLGPDFHRHVRLITGASGGMVGAAYYAAAFSESGCLSGEVTDTMCDETGLDSLTPVARRLVLRDLPMGFFWPFPQTTDRGVELEREWKSLGMPFADLSAGERAGWRPSLVVSPMVVESGRRLLISNLDLSALAETRPLNPVAPASGSDPAAAEAAEAARLYSRSAVEFFRVFPKARSTFSLQTAVRMSATFPLASPAVSLPTDPPRRVVDAGYYDNYGVDLATSWAYQHQDWIRENTSGVALIQIRAYPSEEDVQAYFGLARASTGGVFDFVRRRLITSLQGLTSPLYGGLSAREWSMRFRNAGQVRVLDDTFNRNGDPEFFKSFVFENFTEFAMNWFLTDQDIAGMRQSIGADEGPPAGADGLKSPDEPAAVAAAKRMVKNSNLRVKDQLAAWWFGHAKGKEKEKEKEKEESRGMKAERP